jgi:hypothetical protein
MYLILDKTEPEKSNTCVQRNVQSCKPISLLERSCGVEHCRQAVVFLNRKWSWGLYFRHVFLPAAVPWLKRLVAGLSPRKSGFAPGSIHVGFVVDKVVLRQIFLRVIRFSPANIIPPLLHLHLSQPREVCDSSNQAAHYHHLGPKSGASFLTRYFGWKQNKKVKKIVSTSVFTA